MNRWAHKPMTKTLALLAAVALAIAPVDVLAVCGCVACGCAAAADDSPGCCCTGQTHSDTAQAGGCCGLAKSCDSAAATASDCCQPASAPAAEGCSCSKSVPQRPTGTLPDSRSAPDSQAAATAIAILPPLVALDSAGYLTTSQDQPLWPVPARILLCVWRN